MNPIAVKFAPPLALGLDIGSSSVRCILYDRSGLECGPQAVRPYSFTTSPDGAAQASASTLLELVCSCLDEVLSQAGDRAGEIAAIGICTFAGNIMGVDGAGTPLTPVYTYADVRSAPDAERLKELLDENEVHDRVGVRFHPSYAPAKLLWLARVNPGLFRSIKRFITFGEYLELVFFGRTAVSDSAASWNGLLDVRSHCWDRELLDAIGLAEDRFSPITDVSDGRRGLKPEFAQRWPSLKETVFYPAIGDGAAANVGSGCASPDRVSVTVGTTSALRMVISDPKPRMDPGLWCYRLDRRRLLAGGALNEGGGVRSWTHRVLRESNEISLEERREKLGPDGHGLTMLPFLSGERSPGWVGSAKGSIFGLTEAADAVDIKLAAIEAVNLRIGMVFDLLNPMIPADARVIGSGGALEASLLWRQILADVLGRELVVASVRQASARGAALLALESSNVINDLSAIFLPDPVAYQPNMENHVVYREAKQRQKKLYDLLVAGLPPRGQRSIS